MASLFLAYFCFSSFASDHVPTISPGDIVSADVLRESLDEAAKTMSKTKIDDFLGLRLIHVRPPTHNPHQLLE